MQIFLTRFLTFLSTILPTINKQRVSDCHFISASWQRQRIDVQRWPNTMAGQRWERSPSVESKYTKHADSILIKVSREKKGEVVCLHSVTNVCDAPPPPQPLNWAGLVRVCLKDKLNKVLLDLTKSNVFVCQVIRIFLNKILCSSLLKILYAKR